MLYLVTEIDMYGPSSFLLTAISLISIFLGIYVIISKNPVISILFLIGLFFSISMYLIVIGLHFLGLSYLLIYIGAVSIFFIFIIMLINIRISELLTDNKNSISLAILTVLLFNYTVNHIIPSSLFLYEINVTNVFSVIKNFLVNFIYYLTTAFNADLNSYLLDNTFNVDIIHINSKSWDNIIVTSTHISSIGNILYTNLYILLIIISFILLLAMIGAIVITVDNSKK